MLRKTPIQCYFLLFVMVAVTKADPTDRIYHQSLKNGLDVIVIENATVPLVTIEIEVRNGAFTETAEFDGLSHLFEHMFFKANGSFPNQEQFVEKADELGIKWGATTNTENVNYYFTVHKDNLIPSLTFMKSAITTPLFLQEELEKERIVVIDEYDRNESDPMFHLLRAVDKKLWYEHFTRKNTIGDRNIILTANAEKMRTIQHKYYIPNNSALLVAGDVTHEEVFRLVEEHFGDWERGPDPFPIDFLGETNIPTHPPLKKTETVIVEKPVNAVTIMLSWQGPSVTQNTDDTYAADVFSYLMNQNSKFPNILVSSGLFTNVSFNYQTLNYKGPISIVATTTVKKFSEAKRALFEETRFLIHPDYFSDEQIEFAKNNIAADQHYEWETPSTYIHAVGFWWSVTGNLDYYLNYLDNIKRVTRDDINHYVRKYIQDEPYIMGILLSKEDREELGL